MTFTQTEQITGFIKFLHMEVESKTVPLVNYFNDMGETIFYAQWLLELVNSERACRKYPPYELPAFISEEWEQIILSPRAPQ